MIHHIDFETKNQYNLVIQVVDGGGKTATSTYTINIRDFDEALEPHTTFAPNSCSDIPVQDLSTHMLNQVDTRIEGLTADASTMNLWNTRGDNTGGWDFNENVWTNNGEESIDWSGVSHWNSGGGYQKAGTLITPKHILFANHFPIGIGDTVSFVDNVGNVVNRTLSKLKHITGTDIQVGELDSGVPDSITHYPIDVRNIFPYLNDVEGDEPLVIFDKEDKAIIAKYRNSTQNNNAVVHENFEEGLKSDFYEEIVSGDSGNGKFILINNKPVFLSMHTSASSGNKITKYVNQINTIINDWGSTYLSSKYDLSCFNLFGIEEENSGSSGGTSGGYILNTRNTENRDDKVENSNNTNFNKLFNNLDSSSKREVIDILETLIKINLLPKNLFNDLSYDFEIDSEQSEQIRNNSMTCPAIDTEYQFNRTLEFGSIGEDVRQLQKILNQNGFILSESGVGSIGQETDYFGRLTENALIDFQNACRQEILEPLNLNFGTGFFGQSTIDYINS